MLWSVFTLIYKNEAFHISWLLKIDLLMIINSIYRYFNIFLNFFPFLIFSVFFLLVHLSCHIPCRSTLVRSNQRRCSVRKGVRKIDICKIHRKTPALEYLQLYQKRSSGTGVFLWILWNVYKYLFYRTPPGDCFCLVLIPYVAFLKLQWMF